MDIKGMRVLSVDDFKPSLILIEKYAKSLELEVSSFTNSILALNEALNNQYDIIVLDYMMGEMNGLEFIEKFRSHNVDIPIIMVTSLGDDIELQIKALEMGATEFLNKPVNEPVFKARISNLLKFRKSQLLLKNKTLHLEEEVKNKTQTIQQREHEILLLLGKTAEFKDPETGEHVARVGFYSKMLAEKSGLSREMQDTVCYASMFHDIGKVGIPDSILLKPAKLTSDEFEIMKRHSFIGYNILKSAKSHYLKEGSIIAYTHHEKYDGTGYPRKLKGEDIPISGRIVALTDVFDALTSKRPYKEAWSFDKAVQLIKSERGKHFDPKMVDYFIEEIETVRLIFDSIQE